MDISSVSGGLYVHTSPGYASTTFGVCLMVRHHSLEVTIAKAVQVQKTPDKDEKTIFKIGASVGGSCFSSGRVRSMSLSTAV